MQRCELGCSFSKKMYKEYIRLETDVTRMIAHANTFLLPWHDFCCYTLFWSVVASIKDQMTCKTIHVVTHFYCSPQAGPPFIHVLLRHRRHVMYYLPCQNNGNNKPLILVSYILLTIYYLSNLLQMFLLDWSHYFIGAVLLAPSVNDVRKVGYLYKTFNETFLVLFKIIICCLVI